MKARRTFEEERFMNGFGAQVKMAREVLKLTQDDLAAELKVKPSTVQKWETGRNLPSVVAYLRAREVLKRAKEVRKLAEATAR